MHTLFRCREALHRLEGESEAQQQRLRGELEVTQRRLLAYEALEEQIDSAVMRTAKLHHRPGSSSSGGGSGKNSSGRADGEVEEDLLLETVEESTQHLLRSVKGIPANPERRVRQAVYLAQKLLDTERQRDELKMELAQLRSELQQALEQAEVAHENLSRAAQPTSYLVSKLRDEEAAKAGLVNKCKVLEAEVAQRKKAELEALRDAQQLRERLSSVLQQRGELETVKTMLEQLHAIEEEQDDDYSDEGDDHEGDDHEGDEPEQQLVHGSPERGPSEESKAGTPPAALRRGDTVGDADTPESKLAASATALGLTPEMVQQLTSPPRSSSTFNPGAGGQHNAEQSSGSSHSATPISYRRKVI